MSGAVAAAVLAVSTIGALPAYAGKPAPAPTGLDAQVSAHVDASYDLVVTWNAVPSATSYRVVLTEGGATLSSTTVTTTSWPITVFTAPGTATLSVRGVVGRKPGRTATRSVVLADVTPPTGSYSSSWVDNTGEATITQQTLTDNAPVSGITRTVDWHDPLSPGTVSWPTGLTLRHTYPLTEMRYVPTVTLKDAANNTQDVDAPAVVINDSEAPTGTFVNETATAWASFTQVTVSESDVDDNWTPDELITRSVNWGDGTTTAWTSDSPATHVYAHAGSFTPVVTITDEAGNANPVSTSGVVVTADTHGPTVKVTAPRAKHSVKAWKTLRGTAKDAETGVKGVWLKAVEKRGAAWFGYNAMTHAWVKTASRTKAFKAAKAFSRTTDAQHRWTARLANLRKGTLVFKVRATDVVGNRSATTSRTATLTRA
jgi:5'-nucleotidase